MSRGTPVRTLRVPEVLAAEIEAAISSVNSIRFFSPYAWSEWILQAAREKLSHLERARQQKGRRKRGKRAYGAHEG